MTALGSSAIVTHLWQSTLFAAIVWLAVLALRANHARVRYWLWTAASLKFLIPFSWLVGLGAQVEWESAPRVVQPAASFVIEDVLTPPVLAAAAPAHAAAAPPSDVWPWVLATLWLLGTAGVLAWWWRQWRPVRAALRQAVPIDLDSRFDTAGLVVKSSRSSLEPGVVGILRPVLLMPDGLAERLTPAQLDALLAHERCHVRCRDNLGAAIHMLVEAAFWFHPLVWWIEGRMIDERERACDEAVLRAGSDPQDYAEGILEVCRSSMESPVLCVAGVSGANLRRRIESIMRGQTARPLTIARRLALAFATALLFAIPIGTGVVIAGQDVTVSPDPATPVSFEVAAVRRNTSGADSTNIRWPPGGGYTATNASLWVLITTAYQLRENQLVNAPDWIRNERFDITARLEREPLAVPQGQPDERRLALRSLLADRFKLVLRREIRPSPMYALVLVTPGKPGPRLTRSTADCSPDAIRARMAPEGGKVASSVCGSVYSNNTIRFSGVMSEFAKGLPTPDSRPVVDRTGLAGNWDVDLTYTRGGGVDAPGQALPATDPNAPPPFFTALNDQLGLKLEPITGRLEVLVVDRVERLTDDQAAGQVPAEPVEPRFDAASIRLNTSGAGGGGGRPRAGGGYTFTNMPIRSLVSLAFGIPNNRIIGGPSWMVSDRYDINAIGPAITKTDDAAQMTRALLRDRFQLVARVETREMPVYMLLPARPDGRLGPGLRPAAVDCTNEDARKKAYAAAPPGARMVCGLRFEAGVFEAGGSAVSVVIPELTAASGRPVIDRTGLTGRYDIALRWTPNPEPTADNVSIFTAVQEQLGLKLESGTSRLDVLIVERLERPSED
jgi:uncharacterized protein (TIGR03435 family)